MQNTLVLYASRYGLTDTVAKMLALVLGPARHCTPDEFKDDYKAFDWFVMGGPAYGDALCPALVDFVRANLDWLRTKKVAIFCTCLLLDAGERYLRPLRELLGESVVWARPIGGSVNLNRLLDEDRTAYEEFCEVAGLPFQDLTRFDAEIVAQYALQIKALRDAGGRRMPAQELKSHVEQFLSSHNTCTLSTGFKGGVRGSPLEYSYVDGYVYILSEGGEKFAHIMLNREVSVSIYEPYTTMDRLAGMQIAGEAHIIQAGSPEYRGVLEMKGLDWSAISALPVALHMLKVRLRRVEFLWSAFAGMGHEARQVFEF